MNLNELMALTIKQKVALYILAGFVALVCSLLLRCRHSYRMQNMDADTVSTDDATKIKLYQEYSCDPWGKWLPASAHDIHFQLDCSPDWHGELSVYLRFSAPKADILTFLTHRPSRNPKEPYAPLAPVANLSSVGAGSQRMLKKWWWTPEEAQNPSFYEVSSACATVDWEGTTIYYCVVVQ